MDFIDLKQQQARIAGNLRARIDKVLAHGGYIMGPEVKELEERLAAFVGVRHCVACASGTIDERRSSATSSDSVSSFLSPRSSSLPWPATVAMYSGTISGRWMMFKMN